MKKTIGALSAPPLPAAGLLVFLVMCNASVFASGKIEETPKVPLNDKWTLCITAFDTSSLPESRLAVADVFVRRLINTVKTVNYRIRVSPEYAYYEDYAWSRERTAAAKTLETRYNERALLLYQGLPDWKYRAEIKKKDAEIALARETLARAEAEKPLITREPAFVLAESAGTGTLPAAPLSGGEYGFCQTQKADAFLSGTIQDFHGRYYVTLRLYTLYTRSYIHESDVIFSAEDIESAADEITGGLTAVLAGSKPAAIAVHAEPADTLVLINRNFAGRGNVETRELPAGKVEVALSLEGHKPELIETELAAGELTEISVTLGSLPLGEINIATPGKTGAMVYRGALYVGEAPLTLKLPPNQIEYVNLITRGGETAKAAFFTPMEIDQPHTLSLITKTAPPAGQRRVNRARSDYYWSWGGVWIAGILAWITNGIYSGQNTAIGQSDSQYSEKFINDTNSLYYVSLGAIGLVSAAAVYDIFQMFRYLYVATEGATPIVKTGAGQ